MCGVDGVVGGIVRLCALAAHMTMEEVAMPSKSHEHANDLATRPPHEHMNDHATAVMQSCCLMLVGENGKPFGAAGSRLYSFDMCFR